MHIERIHKMIEKLTECALCEIEKGIECVNTEEMGEVVDMIKDLSEAEYKSLISKEMKEYKEEEKEEEKYLLKMLKEENKDEYKRYQEEYGEDADRRFYDSWRHADGTFARKGTGSYRPRSSGRRGSRGYEESFMPMDMMYDHMEYPPEYWRDMDRQRMNRLYYTDGSYGGNSGQTANMGGGQYGGNSGGSVRGYSDGYNDGYSEGERNGRRQGGDSRYDRARRGYEETKQQHKGNSPEDKQLTMREMEKVLGVVFDEIDEMLEDASPEMKNMVKTKTMSRMQKIQ